MANQVNGLSRTERVRKRHIVSMPKHKRKVMYSQYRDSLGEIFRRLRSCKGGKMMGAPDARPRAPTAGPDGATVAMRPERSEGRRLETPPVPLGLTGREQTTLFKGGS